MVHTVQPGSFSTVGSFSTADPVVGRIVYNVSIDIILIAPLNLIQTNGAAYLGII